MSVAMVLVTYLILIGIVKACILGAWYFGFHQQKAEQYVRGWGTFLGLSDVLVVAAMCIAASIGILPSSVDFGDLIEVNSNFIFRLDPFALTILLMVLIIFGLIGRFSSIYLHRDAHYLKFFSLYYLFQCSAVLLVLSDSFVSFFIGWEILGITSALLIFYYTDNRSAAKNSVRIFALYKISDVLMFAGFAFGLQQSHLTYFSELAQVPSQQVQISMVLISLAFLIKMGGIPFVWLPRAMEGPTPSTAIFYGAIATHVPALLLVSLWQEIEGLWLIRWSLVACALLIIGAATLLGRVEANAKNIAAYGTVQHLSVISVEAVLGFTYLAIIHVILHCIYRLAQFITTPSLLTDYHHVSGLMGRSRIEDKTFYEWLVPPVLSRAVYRVTMREFYILPRLVFLLDQHLGLTTATNRTKIIRTVCPNVLIFMILYALEWCQVGTVQPTLLALVPAWIFGELALFSSSRPWCHSLMVALSVLSLGVSVIYCDGFIALKVLIISQMILCAAFALVYRHRYQRVGSTMSLKSYQIQFAVGLLIVGFPGPGSYLFFERAIHLAIETDVFFASGAFLILSINTLAVLKNYNFTVLNLPATAALYGGIRLSKEIRVQKWLNLTRGSVLQ